MKRKFVSFFLAMVMAVSCTVPAMAADVTADEVDSNESATLIAEPNELPKRKPVRLLPYSICGKLHLWQPSGLW